MFVPRKAEALPSAVAEAGKADGFVHICEQAALMFGSDRRNPTNYRPVVALRSDGPRVIVLPCTRKESQDNPDFFELDETHVMWSRPPNERRSFAYYRYEVVAGANLRGKIGAMPQPARIELLNWLKARY
jgi:hypothetical protein